jgi:hypothetical protein
MDYDAKSGKMVAWNGGSPYALDLDTKAWARISAVGAPARGEWGTYGRFRYLPHDNTLLPAGEDGLGGPRRGRDPHR